VNGSEQEPKAPRSTLHWNVEPGSDAASWNLGVLSLVSVGPVIVV
jgi:hypothetical protein